MTRIARWCYRHAVVVAVIWLAALVLLAGALKKEGRAYTDGFDLPGTDSSTAQHLLAGSAHHPGSGSSGDDTIVFHAGAGADSLHAAKVESTIIAVLAKAQAVHDVAAIGSPYSSGTSGQISADGRTGYATVSFTKPDQNLTKSDISPLVATVSTLRTNQLQVEFGGGGFQTLKGSPLSGSVVIGLVAAAVVLFLAFGSLLATLIPLLAAVISVGAGIETVGLLTHAISINSITPSICALIGIGVAVDYALFVVTRHRSGLRDGLSVEQAAVTALATSGRAVLFAGSTVAVAMLGLLTLGVGFLTGVGLAAAITVAFAVAAAVTLLPALFRLLGLRILSRRDRRRLALRSSDAGAEPANGGDGVSDGSDQGGWSRWALLVERRRSILSVAALVIMVVLLIPAFAIRLGSSDQGNDPSSSTTRRAYDLLAQGFGPGFNGPLVIVANTPDHTAQHRFTVLAAAIRAVPDVARVAVAPTPADGAVAVAQVIPASSPQAGATTSLINTLRDHTIPAAEHGSALHAYIGGQTAVFADFASVLQSKLPIFLTVIVLVGCLLLMIAFRSLIIPLTAAFMNILAAGAAFGVVVAVFQWGWGSDALNLGAPGPIESFLPVMLIAILFGLSMDYQVFLVSRIHEEYERNGADTARAIRRGQASTGRVITAAAAIMIFVFLAFLLEGRRPIGEFGLGLAVAILLDALILRTVLVPAAMHLLGRWNWWLPTGLDRRLPHIRIDTPSAPELASDSRAVPAGSRERS